jgi:hypothetical protein
MRGHGLRVLQRAAGFQIGGDAGGAEGMAVVEREMAHFRKTEPMMAAQIDAIAGSAPGQYMLNFFCHGRRYRTHWLGWGLTSMTLSGSFYDLEA